MPVSVATIRQRIQAQIATALSWNLSAFVYDRFGADPESRAPKAYAVGALRTTPIGGRQRRSEGAYVETTIGVRFMWRIRGDGPPAADYDLALGGEQALVEAVMATDRTDISSITLEDIPDRQVDDTGEWFLGEVRFSVRHLYALQ